MLQHPSWANLLHVLVGLCILVLIPILPAQAQTWTRPELEHSRRVEALIGELRTAEKIDLLLADSPGVPRLDIPPYHWWNEALHGVARNGRATVFPQAINLGATFDPALVRRVGEAISTEARAKFNLARRQGNRGQYAGLTFWSPNVNIFRDLRWGRGQETYGEDPLLTGSIGSAFVRGLQGDHPQYLKAAAAAKHFAVHSGPEAGRSSFNAEVRPIDLSQTYLPAFETLVKEADVEGVMCAYNRINGVPACADTDLLRDTLRGAWDFDGYVVSDCGAIGNIHGYHGYADSPEQAAALALKAGVGINCGSSWKSNLRAALDQGLASEEDLDRALRESLPTLFRLGLFDPPSRVPWRNLGEADLATPENHELARLVATQSMVLLKNEGVLPLNPDLSSLAVMGPTSTSAEVLLANYHGTSDRLSTFLEGMTGGIGGGTKVIHYPSIDIDGGSADENGWGISQAQTTDAIVACIGLSPRFEGEGMETAFGSDEAVIELPQHQVDWIRALREGYDKPLIVVVTGGSPRAIPDIHEMADAVIWSGYPGQAGGVALADLVFGRTNPSGRVPVTVPYRTDDLPPFEDYSMHGRTYRYLEGEPLYPFGFGLSYTRFTYGNLQLPTDFQIHASDSLRLSVELRNVGNREGGEVVQVYLGDPQAEGDLPRWQLVDFRRVELQTGERRTLEFSLPADLLQYYNAPGSRGANEKRLSIVVGGASPLPRAVELGAASPVRGEVNLK